MKIKKIVLMGAIAFLLNSNITLAQEFRGKGDVTFEAGVFSSDPDVDTKRKAIDMAVLSAWKMYTSKFTTAKLNTYKQSKSYFETHLDEFIIKTDTIDEKINSSTNTYSAVVSVEFNDVAIDTKLNEGNDKNGPIGAGLVGSKSLFGYLFLAREQGSIREFKNRETEIKDKSESESEGNEKSQDLVLKGEYGKKQTFKKTSTENHEKTVTGGSTLKQANVTEYKVYSSEDINAAVSDVLSSNNFEVTRFDDCTAQYHGPKLEQIKKEFSNTDELSPEIRLQAIRTLKACDPNMRYFAVGTMDVGMSNNDPVSGNRRVSVNFRTTVWDITSGLPRVVASNISEPKTALGENDKSATVEALKKAANDAANEIVNQLNAKNLK
jgi:hypothetical protein